MESIIIIGINNVNMRINFSELVDFILNKLGVVLEDVIYPFQTTKSVVLIFIGFRKIS